ncbi:MAG TPA: hypothetical protein VG673_09780 [Actinomycetota bacterium]|nr:hypothetical protein [Actinomycetota bacterium]
MSTRGYRVVYDEDVRRLALAELFRELTRNASRLERLGAGPAGQEVTYASANELLVAYQVDHEKRLIQVLSLVWLGAG